MSSLKDIKAQAETIRTNNTANANTPALVGGCLKEIINYVGTAETEIESTKEAAITTITNMVNPMSEATFQAQVSSLANGIYMTYED